jgi:antitoxin (DNA-binding transcriptional repressor) of toxin-antitoxin stability system
MARAVRRSGVRRVPLSEIRDDLSRFLREAEGEEIVIADLPKTPARWTAAAPKAARSKQHCLYAERRTGIAQPAVECAERRAMIGADGKVQGISSAQTQHVLLREASGRAELQPRHRNDGEAVGSQPSKHRQGFGAVNGLDLPGAQLDRKSSRKLTATQSLITRSSIGC